MAAAFLHQGEQGAVLRTELIQGMAEGVEFLGVDRARGLRHIFVLGRKRKEDSAQFLAPEVIDAGVAGEPEKPGLELGGCLQPIDGPDHLDENLLGKVLDGVAPARNRIDKSRHPMLIANDEVTLGVFVAALGAADKVDQRGR